MLDLVYKCLTGRLTELDDNAKRTRAPHGYEFTGPESVSEGEG